MPICYFPTKNGRKCSRWVTPTKAARTAGRCFHHVGKVWVPAYEIYHWDTFDNSTVLIGECQTFQEALCCVRRRYGDRLKANGADQVDIVDVNGNIVWCHKTG